MKLVSVSVSWLTSLMALTATPAMVWVPLKRLPAAVPSSSKDRVMAVAIGASSVRMTTFEEAVPPLESTTV